MSKKALNNLFACFCLKGNLNIIQFGQIGTSRQNSVMLRESSSNGFMMKIRISSEMQNDD